MVPMLDQSVAFNVDLKFSIFWTIVTWHDFTKQKLDFSWLEISFIVAVMREKEMKQALW